MKIIAYLLIAGSLIGLILTDMVVESKIEKINLTQEMFETPDGRTLILSYLESKDSALDLAIVTSTMFILLFGSGIAILFLVRMKKMEKRLDKLDKR